MKLSQNQETFNYLSYLDAWYESLAVEDLAEVLKSPERAAILSVDVIKGFCVNGALYSPRVAGIVDPIVRLMKTAWEKGIRHILLSQDTHEPDAVEFGSWPPHCVRGTEEAETVEEIKTLPFFEKMTVLEKNSIDSSINTELDQWLESHPEVNTFIVVGDCTDLCTYQLAMHLRLTSNALQTPRTIIVPDDCVQTYDMSIETAAEIGAYPHPGDFQHVFFLNHMALNGIKIVKSIK